MRLISFRAAELYLSSILDYIDDHSDHRTNFVKETKPTILGTLSTKAPNFRPTYRLGRILSSRALWAEFCKS